MARLNKTEHAVQELLRHWEEDVQKYPDTEAGQYARVIVVLCAKELRDAVWGPSEMPEEGWADVSGPFGTHFRTEA